MLLLVHGEVTDPAVDFFDREAVFIERHLAPLLDKVLPCECFASSCKMMLIVCRC